MRNTHIKVDEKFVDNRSKDSILPEQLAKLSN